MSTDVSAVVLQRLLDRMPGVTWSARLVPATGKMTWIYVTPKTAELYDVPLGHMLANPYNLMERIVPEDRAYVEQLMAKSAATLAPLSWIGRIALQSGSIRWIETQTLLELDTDGSQLWYGQALDVTARKIAEEALAASEALRAEADALHQQEIRLRNEALAASEAAKTVLIERLRYSIEELSNPILEVWDDVLAMPLIGVVDSRRTADMVQRLLAEVTRTQASFVIVDLTGVEIVDTRTADHLMKLIRKVEIVGARCVLTGIRPAVAEMLVEIGMDFGRITTLRNLKHGLREALRSAARDRDEPHDLDHDDEPGERARKPRARAR